MAAILLRKYINALLSQFTTAYSAAQASFSTQISEATTSVASLGSIVADVNALSTSLSETIALQGTLITENTESIALQGSLISENTNSIQSLTTQVSAYSSGLHFVSGWNAATNTPSLASGIGIAGAMYQVTTAGTTDLDGIIEWEVGDKPVFSTITGSWTKFDGTPTEVSSVVGEVGVITADQIINAINLTPIGQASIGEGLSLNGTTLDVDFGTTTGTVADGGIQEAQANSLASLEAKFSSFQSGADISGTDMNSGLNITYANISDIAVTGNAYLSGGGYIVEEIVFMSTGQQEPANYVSGSAFIMIDGDPLTWTPPADLQIESITTSNSFTSYFGTFTDTGTINLYIPPSVDQDLIAAAVTDPGTLSGSFSGTLNAGIDTQTLTLACEMGRLYVSIYDNLNLLSISTESNITIANSLVGTPTRSGAGVVLGTTIEMIVPKAQDVLITITPEGTFSTEASYLGLVVSSPPNPTPDQVTLTIPTITFADTNGTAIASPQTIVLADGTLTGNSDILTYTPNISQTGSAVSNIAVDIGGTLAGTLTSLNVPSSLGTFSDGILTFISESSNASGESTNTASLTFDSTAIQAVVPVDDSSDTATYTCFKSNESFTFATGDMISIRVLLNRQVVAGEAILLSKDGVNFYNFVMQLDGNEVIYNGQNGSAGLGGLGYSQTDPQQAGITLLDVRVYVGGASDNRMEFCVNGVYPTAYFVDSAQDFTTGVWNVYIATPAITNIYSAELSTALFAGSANSDSSNTSTALELLNNGTTLGIASELNISTGLQATLDQNGVATITRPNTGQAGDPFSFEATCGSGQVIANNVQTPITGCSITIPAATTPRTIYVSGKFGFSGVSNIMQCGFLLDGVQFGQYGFWQSNSVTSIANNTEIIIIPGDNQPHTIQMCSFLFSNSVTVSDGRIVAFVVGALPTVGTDVRLVSTQTVSNVSEVDFIFESGYEYYITAYDINLSKAGSLFGYFGNSTGWLTDSSFTRKYSSSASSSFTNVSDISGAQINSTSVALGTIQSFTIELPGDVGIASPRSVIVKNTVNLAESFNIYNPTTPTAVDSFRINSPSGATISGIFSLYSRKLQGVSEDTNAVITQTISNESEVIFTLNPGYTYRIEAENISTSVSTQLVAQFGTGETPVWDAGASNYAYGVQSFQDNSNVNSGSSSFILMQHAAAVISNQNIKCDIVGDPANIVSHSIEGWLSQSQTFFGGTNIAQAVTAVQIMPLSGTLSGTFRLYPTKNS